MKNAVFKNIIYTALTVFVLSFFLIVGALYSYFSQQHRGALKTEAVYLSAAISECGSDFLRAAAVDGNSRITLIAADGRVLFDSMMDAGQMENHADREEVREALETGTGESDRYSSTLSEKTANYALRLRDGRVLRVSDTQYTILTLLINMFYPILVVLILTITLALVLAARVSKTITEPLGTIDLQNPDDRDVYEELRPLVRRISAQNRQIQRQMDELKLEHTRQDNMRREFTANVSHELKTPLTSISGYAELIRSGLAKPEDVGRFAGKIYDEAQRLMVLVNDIIRLSRLDDKDILEERVPLDLYAMCQDTIANLAEAAQRKQVSFRLTGEHLTLCGVSQILGEIVYNLCDNAVKYNKPGGSVDVSVTRRGEQVVLEVRDTGIGIPESEQERVFERFYRVDKSHSKELGGTGLGLSIVKHGASYHGAQIEIESRLNAGTAIRVIFPG